MLTKSNIWCLLPLLIAGFYPATAEACSCSDVTALDMLNDSYTAYIFTGLVTEARLEKVNGNYVSIEIEIKVEERFKGISAETLTFTAGQSKFSASCGGPISVGSRYVFASSKEGAIFSCTSRPIDRYEIDNHTRRLLQDYRNFASLYN